MSVEEEKKKEEIRDFASFEKGKPDKKKEEIKSFVPLSKEKKGKVVLATDKYFVVSDEKGNGVRVNKTKDNEHWKIGDEVFA